MFFTWFIGFGFHRPLRPFRIVAFCGATWDTAATPGVYWVIILKRHSVYPSSWLTKDMTQVQLLFFDPFSPIFQSWATVIAFPLQYKILLLYKATGSCVADSWGDNKSGVVSSRRIRVATMHNTCFAWTQLGHGDACQPVGMLVSFPCRGGNKHTRNDKHFFHFSLLLHASPHCITAPPPFFFVESFLPLRLFSRISHQRFWSAMAEPVVGGGGGTAHSIQEEQRDGFQAGVSVTATQCANTATSSSCANTSESFHRAAGSSNGSNPKTSLKNAGWYVKICPGLE